MAASETTTDHFKPRSPTMKTLVERGYTNQATDHEGIDAAFDESIVPSYDTRSWNTLATARIG
ncbi:hypothetical protein EHI44_21750 [Rhizobium leguminosarum]|uniref:hypothetical protein n=1 Tax=Rhizobium leguminosarum TaxID=384 RepID=UPI000FF63430|nr:hypothetical protein [Rhizobium leguminosarum]RWY83946.1 hypothetical protein EHI44_21750 [Rhizobium leguminosarum]